MLPPKVHHTDHPHGTGILFSASKYKTPVHTGTGANSRGTTQIDHFMVHFLPTIIGFPDNAGIAAWATDFSPRRLKRELQLGWVERKSQLFLRISGNFHQSTFLCHCHWTG